MSQINDALKRAKHAQRKQSPSISSTALPLRPFDSRTEENSPTWIWPVAIILFFLLCAGLFFAISAGNHSTKQVVVEPTVVPTEQVRTVVAPSPNPPKPLAAVAEIAALKPVKTARIQGIVFDPVNPWAIIGGKTIHVGDAVDGMQVSAISRDAITLVGNGQTKQLHVGEK